MTAPSSSPVAPPVGPRVAEHRFRAMSTDVHLIVVDGHPDHLALAEEAVHERERRWSRFLPYSEISILNDNAGRPVVLSRDTYELVGMAVEAHRRTAGRFDPTVLRSLLAAGYDRSIEQVTGDGPVEHRPAPTPHGIEMLDGPGAVHLPPGVGIDLGGIAKGATADAVTALVVAAGAGGCCVNIGGDLRVRGRPPQPEGWIVELEATGADGAGAVRLSDGAVCTSTTLLRRWGSSGEHHLRDPATGGPATSDLVTVSLIAARATQAEVLTKVAMLAGAQEAATLLPSLGVTGLLVGPDGTIEELAGYDAFRWEGSVGDEADTAAGERVGEAAPT